MAEWLGHLMSNFPIWLIIPIGIIIGIAYYGLGGPRKHEWPEDKKKRLAKIEAKKKAKVTKG